MTSPTKGSLAYLQKSTFQMSIAVIGQWRPLSRLPTPVSSEGPRFFANIDADAIKEDDDHIRVDGGAYSRQMIDGLNFN